MHMHAVMPGRNMQTTSVIRSRAWRGIARFGRADHRTSPSSQTTRMPGMHLELYGRTQSDRDEFLIIESGLSEGKSLYTLSIARDPSGNSTDLIQAGQQPDNIESDLKGITAVNTSIHAYGESGTSKKYINFGWSWTLGHSSSLARLFINGGSEYYIYNHVSALPFNLHERVLQPTDHNGQSEGIFLVFPEFDFERFPNPVIEPPTMAPMLWMAHIDPLDPQGQRIGGAKVWDITDPDMIVDIEEGDINFAEGVRGNEQTMQVSFGAELRLQTGTRPTKIPWRNPKGLGLRLLKKVTGHTEGRFEPVFETHPLQNPPIPIETIPSI